jgi:hypothetical protein
MESMSTESVFGAREIELEERRPGRSAFIDKWEFDLHDSQRIRDYRTLILLPFDHDNSQYRCV